jgi:hypothetical protein
MEIFKEPMFWVWILFWPTNMPLIVALLVLNQLKL